MAQSLTGGQSKVTKAEYILKNVIFYLLYTLKLFFLFFLFLYMKNVDKTTFGVKKKIHKKIYNSNFLVLVVIF
jgi:hypothetical protein